MTPAMKAAEEALTETMLMLEAVAVQLVCWRKEPAVNVEGGLARAASALALIRAEAAAVPAGSNADEWRLFLAEYKDAPDFVAVQIAETIDHTKEAAAKIIGAAIDVVKGYQNFLVIDNQLARLARAVDELDRQVKS